VAAAEKAAEKAAAEEAAAEKVAGEKEAAEKVAAEKAAVEAAAAENAAAEAGNATAAQNEAAECEAAAEAAAAEKALGEKAEAEKAAAEIAAAEKAAEVEHIRKEEAAAAKDARTAAEAAAAEAAAAEAAAAEARAKAEVAAAAQAAAAPAKATVSRVGESIAPESIRQQEAAQEMSIPAVAKDEKSSRLSSKSSSSAVSLNPHPDVNISGTDRLFAVMAADDEADEVVDRRTEEARPAAEVAASSNSSTVSSPPTLAPEDMEAAITAEAEAFVLAEEAAARFAAEMEAASQLLPTRIPLRAYAQTSSGAANEDASYTDRILAPAHLSRPAPVKKPVKNHPVKTKTNRYARLEAEERLWKEATEDKSRVLKEAEATAQAFALSLMDSDEWANEAATKQGDEAWMQMNVAAASIRVERDSMGRMLPPPPKQSPWDSLPAVDEGPEWTHLSERALREVFHHGRIPDPRRSLLAQRVHDVGHNGRVNLHRNDMHPHPPLQARARPTSREWSPRRGRDKERLLSAPPGSAAVSSRSRSNESHKGSEDLEDLEFSSFFAPVSDDALATDDEGLVLHLAPRLEDSMTRAPGTSVHDWNFSTRLGPLRLADNPILDNYLKDHLPQDTVDTLLASTPTTSRMGPLHHRPLRVAHSARESRPRQAAVQVTRVSFLPRAENKSLSPEFDVGLAPSARPSTSPEPIPRRVPSAVDGSSSPEWPSRDVERVPIATEASFRLPASRYAPTTKLAAELRPAITRRPTSSLHSARAEALGLHLEVCRLLEHRKALSCAPGRERRVAKRISRELGLIPPPPSIRKRMAAVSNLYTDLPWYDTKLSL
jgi:hypothetical protein